MIEVRGEIETQENGGKHTHTHTLTVKNYSSIYSLNAGSDDKNRVVMYTDVVELTHNNSKKPIDTFYVCICKGSMKIHQMIEQPSEVSLSLQMLPVNCLAR